MRRLLVVSLVLASVASGCSTTQSNFGSLALQGPQCRSFEGIPAAAGYTNCGTVEVQHDTDEDARKRAFALWLANRPPPEADDTYVPVHFDRPPPTTNPIAIATPTHCRTAVVLRALQTDCY